VTSAPLVDRLAERVRRAGRRTPRVLVGVDGPDAAGKTTLADAVAAATPALRASIDGFHRPRAARYRCGDLSAEGYYRDAFDIDAFVERCARPFLAGARRVATRTFDLEADAASVADAIGIDREAILIVDGVFLLRPELAPLWTVSVYLSVSPEESMRRALTRDVALMGSADRVRRRYLARYLPGQALYRRAADPESVADIVIDNERVDAPRILRWR
jgi:uridine kinase